MTNPGVDAPALLRAVLEQLLRAVLEQLVGKVSHVVLHVGVTTDPRFAAAVPGTVLMGSDVAWVFGPERYPEGTRIVPGECNAIGRLGQGPTEHPCPRCLGHVRWLVRWFSLPGETVLDPFMGSGTTLVAAREHGRAAEGWDIETK